VPLVIGRVLAKEVARVTDQAIKTVTDQGIKTVTNRDNNAVTFCKCGCLRELTGRKQYFDGSCRKRAERRRKKKQELLTS